MPFCVKCFVEYDREVATDCEHYLFCDDCISLGIPREKIVATVGIEGCKKQNCKFSELGCSFQGCKFELDIHYKNDSTHLELLLSAFSQLKRTVKDLKEDKETLDLQFNIEEQQQFLVEINNLKAKNEKLEKELRVIKTEQQNQAEAFQVLKIDIENINKKIPKPMEQAKTCTRPMYINERHTMFSDLLPGHAVSTHGSSSDIRSLFLSPHTDSIASTPPPYVFYFTVELQNFSYSVLRSESFKLAPLDYTIKFRLATCGGKVCVKGHLGIESNPKEAITENVLSCVATVSLLSQSRSEVDRSVKISKIYNEGAHAKVFPEYFTLGDISASFLTRRNTALIKVLVKLTL